MLRRVELACAAVLLAAVVILVGVASVARAASFLSLTISSAFRNRKAASLPPFRSTPYVWLPPR